MKWYSEGVNLGSGWRETTEGQVTLVWYPQFYFLLTWWACLTKKIIILLIYAGSFATTADCALSHSVALQPWGMEWREQQNERSDSESGALVMGRGGTWGKGFSVTPSCLPVCLIEGKVGFSLQHRAKLFSSVAAERVWVCVCVLSPSLRGTMVVRRR